LHIDAIAVGSGVEHQDLRRVVGVRVLEGDTGEVGPLYGAGGDRVVPGEGIVLVEQEDRIGAGAAAEEHCASWSLPHQLILSRHSCQHGGPPSGSTITMLLGSKTVLLPLVIRYTAPMPVQLTAKPGTVASDSMLGTASNVYVSLFGLLVSKKSRVS